jgi:hypothetical protein
MDAPLQVLDWIARGLGVLVLLAAVILLFVWIWDLSHPLPEQEFERRLTVVTEVAAQSKPKIVQIYEGLGLIGRFDYAEFGGGIKDRLGHCYMLAAKAALYTSGAAYPLPKPVAVIHGSMHGPDAAERIGHAIVLLEDGNVWEPITSGIYNREQFESYSRWHRHHIHTVSEVRHWMRVSGNYGPWITTDSSI